MRRCSCRADTAELFAEGGRREAGAFGKFEGAAVGGEFLFLAGGLVAEGDRVLGILVKREDGAVRARRLGCMGEGVREDGGEFGFGAGVAEEAGGDNDGRVRRSLIG